MKNKRKTYITPTTEHILQQTEKHLLAGTWIEPEWKDETFNGEFDAKQQDFTEFEPFSDLQWDTDVP